MDNAVPRFTSVDRLAEKYYSWSPYAYVMNNPLKYIDPTGRDLWDFIVGIGHSIGSNLTLGASKPTGEMASNPSHYNVGRDVGDIISIGMGVSEISTGGNVAAGGVITEVGSAGTTTVVSAPAIAAGTGMVLHGGGVIGVAAKSLVNKEGRVSEASSSNGSGGESSKGGGKNGAHANQKAKESAAKRYETVKEKLNNMNKTPNKTPELKKEIQQLEREVKQLQQKKIFQEKIIVEMQKEIDNE